MATVHVKLVSCRSKAVGGDVLPVPQIVSVAKALIEPTAASQVVPVAVPAGQLPEYLQWLIDTDVDIWIKGGAAPVAAAGDEHRIFAGTDRAFGVTSTAEQIAVVLA